MNTLRLFLVLTVVSVLLALGGGCATYRKCGFTGCPGDSKIAAAVQAALAQFPPLSTNSVRVQTLDTVVYLTGHVDTDVERFLAVSVASNVPDVSRVVDSISVENGSR